MANQVGLVFLLIYACGALVELLIRMSLGVPAWARPAFEQHIFLIALQPIVFILLPALLWPLVALYRLLRPVYDFIAKRCTQRKRDATAVEREAAAAGAGAPTTTANGGIPPSPSRASITSSIHDLEKQEIHIEMSSKPSASSIRMTRT